MSLQIIQAKPNPTGKEMGIDMTDSSGAKPAALLGEWVDVKNLGNDSIHFSTIQLRHALFDETCHSTGLSELYWQGGSADFLKPGQVLRIHAGRTESSTAMAPDDQAGADWHGYTESDEYVLNLRCGDKIIVMWRDAFERGFQDWACYAPYPPVDMILRRSGNLLAGAGVGMTF